MELKNLALFLLLLNCFFVLSAHLDAGEDKIVDEYLVDFGYFPEKPNETSKIFLSFNLVNETSKIPIDITSVWIRISNSKEVVFSGEFLAKNGNAGFNYKFPYPEDYEIKTQFKKEGEVLVETDFLISVENDANKNRIFLMITVLLILALIMLKKQNRK